MQNYYTHKNTNKNVTYKTIVTECPETRQPIWKFEFYLEEYGFAQNLWIGSNNSCGKSHVIDRKTLVLTVNDYMSYDDIWLMQELILNEY